MLKRILDITLSSFGLILASPVLIVVMILVWLQDFHSPFYIAQRIGKNGKPFQMVKMRSMVTNAESSGVDSTSQDDKRITYIGKFIRAYKIDEITQLWNVLTGQMSLVGPRPNVKRDVDLYTDEEKKILSAKPGITDFSSIVFSDEGEILKGAKDPDLKYNQVIRPWKSRLILIYIEHQSLALDLRLILLTCLTLISRQKALKGVQKILKRLGADEKVINIALRKETLPPHPPPGTHEIVMAR